MSISARDRKILWSRAGNQCAFPGCRQALVEKAQGTEPGIVVGEEAHILPKGIGPRVHETVTDGRIDSCVNIILLCPTHHTIVDKMREVYTTQALLDMKQSHEQRVSNKRVQIEDDPTVAIEEDGAHVGGQIVNAWETEESAVVVSSYGTLPVRQRSGRWRAAGVRIGQSHIRTPRTIHWLFESSEARPDVEYWCTESKLHVVQETFLYDERRFAPFAEHVFNLAQVPASSRVTLLVDVEPSIATRVPEFVKQIQSIDRDDDSDRLDVLLCQLWRAGLSEPKRVREEFIKFKDAWWYRGENGETIVEMLDELAVVQRALDTNHPERTSQ